MNSQFQKPSTGSKGGRSLAGDPPYAPDKKPGAHSAGTPAKSDKGGFSPSGGSGPSDDPLASGSSSFKSGDSGSKPVVGPSFGGGDLGSKSGSGESSGTSGISNSGADNFGGDNWKGSTDNQKGSAAVKSRPTGTEALVEETRDTFGRATETVNAASGAVHDATAQIADVAKEAFAATVSAVTAQASALTANITDELTHTAEAQKERGTDAMHRLAKAIRTAAQELDDGSPEIARRVRAAAGSVDSLSSNLHGKSIGDLFAAASDFARNQPAAFFAGAVIAGFAFSRFLKSSSQPPAPPNGGHEATPPATTPPFGTGNVSPTAPPAASF